jgi:protein-S-isoprenylcysteine O-methyltransferase Ste14
MAGRPFMTSVSQMLLALGFIFVFGYFTAAGASIFERDESDVKGMMWGQFSLLVTGAIGAALLSFRQVLHPVNGIVAAILLLGAVSLYEWARRTIRERRFHIGWSGDVPDAVCDKGPYAFVRHPVYLSYMLAFLAVPIAFPRLPTLAILVFNVGLYIHAARDDERSIEASGLRQAYAAYRARTGMFVPRLRRASHA